MTLILSVGNFRGVHQSSDYQLTDPNSGAPVSDQAGSKQLQAGFMGQHLQLAFTGTAAVRKGASVERTIDWISAELNALPHDASLQQICDALSRRSASAMTALGPRGVLTLVLAAWALRLAQYSDPAIRFRSRYRKEKHERLTCQDLRQLDSCNPRVGSAARSKSHSWTALYTPDAMKRSRYSLRLFR
jgi:hypothetical protein